MKTLMRLLLWRGLIVMLAAGFLVTPSFSQKAKKKTAKNKLPTVLFVCEHGAAKSVIAAAYFDKFAQQQGLKYKAVFRGTNPDPMISPVTKQGLKEDGIETPDQQPTLVSKYDMDAASQIITLGCSLPKGSNVAAKLTDWNEIPSPSNYPLARDAISKRVQSLVADLAKKETKKSKQPAQ